MRALTFLALALLGAGPAAAQARASLGAGVGTVRHAGGSSFSATTLTPIAQFVTPTLLVGGGGSLAWLPDGAWAAAGQADGWASTPATSPLRLAVGASLAGSAVEAQRATATHLVAEALWAGARGGVGVGAGPSWGATHPGTTVRATRIRARAWWQGATTQLSMSVEPTRFEDAWYTDVNAGAGLERGALDVSAWIVGRFSGAYGSKGTGGVQAQYSVSPHVSLEVSIGGFLPDPFQALPRARSVSAGIRLHAWRRPSPAAPHRSAWPALVPERRGGGDSIVVRFHMPGARSLAIAGDWNGWAPVPLRALGGAGWEAALALSPGTYHFNLLLNGEDWVVPGGAALVPDGMGGLVAVLVVLPRPDP